MERVVIVRGIEQNLMYILASEIESVSKNAKYDGYITIITKGGTDYWIPVCADDSNVRIETEEIIDNVCTRIAHAVFEEETSVISVNGIIKEEIERYKEEN